MDIWAAIRDFNESQTAIVTTMMLIIGGGVGVLLGSWLFGGRVTNLKAALDETLTLTKTAMEQHSRDTQEKLSEMNEQLASTMALLGQLKSSVSDIQQDAEAAEENVGPQAQQDIAHLRGQLKQHWYAIRDELWLRANNPTIHGKTRRRYSGFSNYEIAELIAAMREDNNLSQVDAERFQRAAHLWTWHRNGRATLSENDVQQMRDFKLQLVPTRN